MAAPPPNFLSSPHHVYYLCYYITLSSGLLNHQLQSISAIFLIFLLLYRKPHTRNTTVVKIVSKISSTVFPGSLLHAAKGDGHRGIPGQGWTEQQFIKMGSFLWDHITSNLLLLLLLQIIWLIRKSVNLLLFYSLKFAVALSSIFF